MNRLVSIITVIAVSVFGIGQLCFAQVQILDGNGEQVAPNTVPAERVQQPAIKRAPQILGGNGSSIIIRKSFSSVDENGDLKTESSGKAIVIGPDGKRQEFDLNDDQGMNLKIGPMTIEGLDLGPAANEQVESFWLGLQCKPVPPAVASQLNLETGLMVSRVPSESPAATAGVQQFDVLLYADDKQLTRQTDLTKAVQSAGEADANISLTLIRGGKEMSVTVKPEKRLANPNNLRPMNRMPQIDLPAFDEDGLFAEDALGDGMEARMRLQMEKMEERVRRIQEHLGNGLIELPLSPLQER